MDKADYQILLDMYEDCGIDTRLARAKIESESAKQITHVDASYEDIVSLGEIYDKETRKSSGCGTSYHYGTRNGDGNGDGKTRTNGPFITIIVVGEKGFGYGTYYGNEEGNGTGNGFFFGYGYGGRSGNGSGDGCGYKMPNIIPKEIGQTKILPRKPIRIRARFELISVVEESGLPVFEQITDGE